MKQKRMNNDVFYKLNGIYSYVIVWRIMSFLVYFFKIHMKNMYLCRVLNGYAVLHTSICFGFVFHNAGSEQVGVTWLASWLVIPIFLCTFNFNKVAEKGLWLYFSVFTKALFCKVKSIKKKNNKHIASIYWKWLFTSVCISLFEHALQSYCKMKKKMHIKKIAVNFMIIIGYGPI